MKTYSQRLNVVGFQEKKEIVHSVIDRAMISATGHISIEFNEFVE